MPKKNEAVNKRKDGTTYPDSIHLQYLATQTPPINTAIVQDTTDRLCQEKSARLRGRAIEAARILKLMLDYNHYFIYADHCSLLSNHSGRTQE